MLCFSVSCFICCCIFFAILLPASVFLPFLSQVFHVCLFVVPAADCSHLCSAALLDKSSGRCITHVVAAVLWPRPLLHVGQLTVSLSSLFQVGLISTREATFYFIFVMK